MLRKKLKPTLQISNTECGICCVRTILEFFEHQTSLTELRKIKEPGRDGLSLKGIKSLLSAFGMHVKSYKINDIRAFHMIKFPVIAFWKGYHFVCIESLNKKEAIIMDPSLGRIKVSISDFTQNFSNYIVVATPNSKFEKKQIKNYKKWLKDYIWPKNVAMIYVNSLISSLLSIAITLGIPIFTQKIIDNDYLESQSMLNLLCIVMVVTILFILSNLFRAYLAIKLSYKFNVHLLFNAFEHLLSLPAKYFSVRTPGEIVYRMNSLTRIQDVLGVTLVQTFLDFISSIVLISYIFWVSKIIGVVLLLIIFSMFLFLKITQSHIDSATDKEINEGATAQSIQIDALSSINSVKIGGYVRAYYEDWTHHFKSFLSAYIKRSYIQQGIVSSVLSGIQLLAPIFILIISLYLANHKIITFGQAIGIQTIISLLLGYTNSFFGTMTNVLTASRYVELADDIFGYPRETYVESEHDLKEGSVSIRDLEFKYSSDSPTVLRNINLDIKDNETVALVGLSGSGKTTLAKICCSLFKPTKGEVYFSGIEYKKFDLEKLRSSISYIPQEAHLHNRTIMDNLQLGTSLTRTEIERQCQKLEFLNFINKLPMKYDTVVSEMGANFSGGQRQRIHIAKSILQDPKILIMDEATSSLDNISQESVYNVLSKLNCTKLIVAHRLETILNANKIVVLKDGEIAQVGTHEDLIDNQGEYKKLFNTVITDSSDNKY